MCAWIWNLWQRAAVSDFLDAKDSVLQSSTGGKPSMSDRGLRDLRLLSNLLSTMSKLQEPSDFFLSSHWFLAEADCTCCA